MGISKEIVIIVFLISYLFYRVQKIQFKNEERSLMSDSHDSNLKYPMVFSSEVELALKNGNAIVALESTIITHGMNYPANYETAVRVENQVRKYGATPATIAVIKGKIHVGLDDEKLKNLAKMDRKEVIKCSRRDLAFAIAQEKTCGTTVAGTMIVANFAGISVFVTGGVGGVHKEFKKGVLDISADLDELGKTPVCVVSAGVKSILDIPNTLEYLETKGVPVVAFNTSEFPAFYNSKSGVKAPIRIDTTKEVAKVLQTNLKLNLGSGMLVSVPIPEDEEMNSAEINKAIAQGILEVEEKNIKGKDITPYLLERIVELTEGKSLESNIALILNNAKIGAQIAAELSKMEKETKVQPKIEKETRKRDLILIGGSAVDLTSRARDKIEFKTSQPGNFEFSFGGVAKNVMEGIRKLEVENSFFISAVGQDIFGDLLLDYFKKELNFVDTSGIFRSKEYSTAVFNAILESDGDLLSAIADMDILESNGFTEHIMKFKDSIRKAKYVFFDANLSVDAMNKICQIIPGKFSNEEPQLLFEPTSISKSAKIFDSDCFKKVSWIKPNKLELISLAKKGITDSGMNRKNEVSSIEEAIEILLAINKNLNILVTQGKDNVVHAFVKDGEVTKNSYPVRKIKDEKIKSTVGCGDSSFSGFLFGKMNGYSVEDSIKFGTIAGGFSAKSIEPVSKKITKENLLKKLRKM